MAGDWIKVEKATRGKPEVLRLAVALNVHPMHALGLCVAFWSWADDQLTDGHAVGVTKEVLDTHLGHAGFCEALESVGWLQVRSGSLVVPHFDRNLSESAKNRALAKDRKGKQRQSKPVPASTVPKVSRSDRDKSGTREEIEKNNSPPPSLSPELAKVWPRWEEHRRQKLKPLSSMEADAQLMQLTRCFKDPADQVDAVEYSIGRGAVNLILNGDHKRPEQVGLAGRPARRGPSQFERLGIK